VFDDGRVLETLEQLTTDAAKHAAAPVWSLSDAELVDCLNAAHRLEQAAAAVKHHLVRQIDARDIPAAQGHRSTASWLRSWLLLDPQPARDLVEQSAAFDRRPMLDEALSSGVVDVRQAAVIAAAIDAIPAEVGARATAEAETMLIDLAARFEPFKLRRLGARILDHIAPEVAERADKAALDRMEARAYEKRSVTLSLPVDGRVRLSGSLTVEDAAIIGAALEPLCTPRPGDARSPGQQRADALVDVCRLALRTGNLPDNGGEPPQVAVTLPFDALTQQLGVATLDTGERIAPAAARRLACDAQILPVVLGGAGQVLDVGRARRLATGSLRRALVVRDRGCAFPDCDRPPRWCDAHHLVSWADGGPTELANLVLLCRRHHRLVHRGEWRVRLGHDDLPEFLPPAYVDREQRPRRNLYHPRT
jgi:hypothetical protein